VTPENEQDWIPSHVTDYIPSGPDDEAVGLLDLGAAGPVGSR